MCSSDLLQVLMPGETAAPGTVSGKTGTPTAQSAGNPVTVTVRMVDQFFNLVSSTDTVAITSSDVAATLPANAALVAGSKTFNVTFNTAGSRTVTATDVTNGAITAGTSTATTINVAAVSAAIAQGSISGSKRIEAMARSGRMGLGR